MAGANPAVSLSGHTNGHQDRSPPGIGEIDGHPVYTHIAPDEDTDIYTEGQSGHCPTLESHIQAPSRDMVITNRNTRRQLR